MYILPEFCPDRGIGMFLRYIRVNRQDRWMWQPRIT